MIGRGSRLGAARLLCAAAALALVPAALSAQAAPPTQPPPPDPAELDPSAPLDAMPDLGVAWPDLKASDTASPPPAVTPSTPAKKTAGREATEITGDLRYSVQVEGLAPIGGGTEDLLHQFRQQSLLEAERKHTANAAQIGRRASADDDLLEELLRSQGYYDADVEPRTEKAGAELRVVLTADPGQQYRFASVELPGLEAAG